MDNIINNENQVKVAIVYFSLEGNTEYVADKISEYIDVDVLRLEPVKNYPQGNVSKYVWGGKSATFGEKPKLVPYQFSANQYDVIIIGTPVWASTFTPPIKTFLKENNISEKKIALYVCYAGGQTKKCFNKLKKELPDCDIITTLALLDPKTKQNAINDVKIKEFCAKIKNNM